MRIPATNLAFALALPFACGSALSLETDPETLRAWLDRIDRADPAGRRATCVAALAGLGAAAVAPLGARLDGPSLVRAPALEALALMARTEPLAATFVFGALERDDPSVVRSGVFCASLLGERAAPVAGLVRDYAERSRGTDRALAMRALGSIGRAGGAEVLDALVMGLLDPDERVRVAACRAIARLGPTASEALPVLDRIEDRGTFQTARAARFARARLTGEPPALEPIGEAGGEPMDVWCARRAEREGEHPSVLEVAVDESLAGGSGWFTRWPDALLRPGGHAVAFEPRVVRRSGGAFDVYCAWTTTLFECVNRTSGSAMERRGTARGRVWLRIEPASSGRGVRASAAIWLGGAGPAAMRRARGLTGRVSLASPDLGEANGPCRFELRAREPSGRDPVLLIGFTELAPNTMTR